MSRSSRRGPWLPEEDGTLLHLVRTQGPNNWVRISQHMLLRSPKQCRERYHQNLKPSLNHEPISAQEGELIEQLVLEMGKRWAEIARRLGNRSDNAVKNWWNGSMNRRKRSTVPQSGGSKGVGPRTQPLPTTTGPPLFHRPLYLHEHSAPDRLLGPPSFHQHGFSSSRFLEHEQRYSAPPQSGRHAAYGQMNSRPLQYSHNQPPTSPQRYTASPGLLSPVDNLLPRIRGFSSDRPDYQLPPLNVVEQSAPSPAATETSQVSSNQLAPSLVSDNQSNSSISPKTVTSPRPGLPSSKMPLTDMWPELQRRNSTGNYPDDTSTGSVMKRPEDDLRGYHLAKHQDRLSQPFTYAGSPAHRPDLNATRPNKERIITGLRERKDSRMKLSSLMD